MATATTPLLLRTGGDGDGKGYGDGKGDGKGDGDE